MNNQYIYLPNFLGIGAQKSGTTWLYHNLSMHPEFYLPPVKELHYFDRSPNYPSSSRLASESLFARLFGKRTHDIEARRYIKSRLHSILRNPSLHWKTLPWEFRFLFGKYNDAWYASLFKRGKGKIKGEITPSYSVLNPPDVEKIHKLISDVKIIFIIRNPIDRTWSHLRFHNSRFDIKGFPTLKELKQFVESPSVTLKGDYIRTIKIWRKYFPEDQFFICFYDDIKESPRSLFLRILEFLGSETTEKDLTADFSKRIYASPKLEMPSELKRYLSDRYFQQIKGLSQMLGGHATDWLNDIV